MQDVRSINFEQLSPIVKEYFDNGYRFVTIDCVQIDDEIYQHIYHFDKDLSLEHLRVEFKKSDIVPSISPIYFCGLVVENEIQDMFGIKFSDLVVDFGGRLLLTDHYAEPPQVISNLVVSVAEIDKPAKVEETSEVTTEGGAANE